nr:hypothetical protein [Tanacetum cinerariifolium]
MQQMLFIQKTMVTVNFLKWLVFTLFPLVTTVPIPPFAPRPLCNFQLALANQACAYLPSSRIPPSPPSPFAPVHLNPPPPPVRPQIHSHSHGHGHGHSHNHRHQHDHDELGTNLGDNETHVPEHDFIFPPDLDLGTGIHRIIISGYLFIEA